MIAFKHKDNLMIFTLILICLAVIFSYGVSSVSAAPGATIYVNGSSGNDSWNGQSAKWISGTIGPKKSVKNATGTVNNGGTIIIANGKYGGNNNYQIDIKKNMTIKGQSKAGTVINGTGTNNWIFGIKTGVNIKIINITMINAKGMTGGAISNQGNLTVIDCAFTGSTATYGGGAIDNFDKLTVIKSIFTGNKATNGEGGAIKNNGGSLTVTNSIFKNNFANGGGGAIYNYNFNYKTGTCTVSNSTFTGNNVGSNVDGGAICNDGAILTVTGNNTFTNNNASHGGAICNGGGILTVKSSSTFTGNTALYDGGAIFNYKNGIANINNNIFTSNHVTSATGSAGAIYHYGSTTLTIYRCTFKYNYAAYGGAIHNYNNMNITGSTFTGNNATYGGAIENGGNLNITGSTFTGNNATNGGAILNSYAATNVHFSRIIGNKATSHGSSINNNGGTVDAALNWWGSNTGPAAGSIYGASNPTTWLILNITASPSVINNITTSTITADLTRDNKGTYHNPASGHVSGIKVTFTTTLGTIISPVTTINGIAKSTLKGGLISGNATVSAKVDSQTVKKSVIINNIPPKVKSIDPTNNAVNISINKIIKVAFSEKIKAGSNCWIELKSSNGTAKTFTKSISSNVLTITPTGALSKGVKYTLILHSGSITDLVGNPLAPWSSSFTTSKA
ncbi:Ig-like domain-containing protein [Methanobacterium sp.]|uniref:Ig-like domain-containing protein n=1 Tax=Methanobacterium sp. TaxID=2164 RepID=UPI003C7086E8